MSNKVDYIYCNICGYEGIEVTADYSRQTADGEYYLCPLCNSETSCVEVEEL